MNIAKNIIIAFAVSTALVSCTSSNLSRKQEKKYSSIEAEINNDLGFFDNENEVSAKNEKLVISALEESLQNNDFDYAKKYCALLKNLNYPEYEKYYDIIRAAKATYLKDTLLKSLKENNFVNARKYCDELKIVNYSIADTCREEIRHAESTFFISKNGDDANNILIASIDTWPSEKTKIGKETESVHMYDVQAKAHNKRLDEYLDLALKYKNDKLAKRLLEFYADELKYESITKNGNNINVVTGYSDESKNNAMKRYESAKKHW